MKETHNQEDFNKDDLMNFIINRILELRTARGLSLEDLAENAGISESMMQKISIGITNPSICTLTKICNALRVSLCEFFSTYQQKEYCSNTFSFDITLNECEIIVEYREYSPIFQKRFDSYRKKLRKSREEFI